VADKLVQKREKSSQAVATSFQAHGDQVSGKLGELLRPYLEEGEELPDLKLFMGLVTKHMAGVTTGMKTASDAHEEEIADDAMPRQELEESRLLLRSKFIASRANIETQFGRVGLKTLGIEGQTPNELEELVTAGKRLVKNLRDPHLELPPPLMASLAPNRAGLADEVDAASTALTRAKGKVAAEARELEGTLAVKHRSMDAHDQTFGRCARWLEATYELAGAQELAGRIRPSTRSPGTLDSVSEGSPEPGEPAEGAPAPTETPSGP